MKESVHRAGSDQNMMPTGHLLKQFVDSGLYPGLEISPRRLKELEDYEDYYTMVPHCGFSSDGSEVKKPTVENSLSVHVSLCMCTVGCQNRRFWRL